MLYKVAANQCFYCKGMKREVRFFEERRVYLREVRVVVEKNFGVEVQ